MNPLFIARISVEQVKEGVLLVPKFDANGLIPLICQILWPCTDNRNFNPTG
jgi:hypothetical protein